MEKLSVLYSTDCKGAKCPTIYKDKEGRIFVQGYVVPNSSILNNDIPEGESLLEISQSLLDAIKNGGSK